MRTWAPVAANSNVRKWLVMGENVSSSSVCTWALATPGRTKGGKRLGDSYQEPSANLSTSDIGEEMTSISSPPEVGVHQAIRP